jgi:SAM-dependent methyltransferase
LTAWYEDWFGEDYLQLYPHRNEVDAARLIDLAGSRVSLDGTEILDLACGPGRHAAQLASRGARVTGIDLSAVLLDTARLVSGLNVVRGDMRILPYVDNSFDGVVNLFTSFGYFEDDDEHLAVLKEVSRVLRPAGTFVLDFLNAKSTVQNMVPRETTDMGRETVDVTREVTGGGRFVEKTISRKSDGRVFKERVRLFSPEELISLVEAAGMKVTSVVGDYDGGELSDSSNRTILFSVNT